jgi:hypothetical protein
LAFTDSVFDDFLKGSGVFSIPIIRPARSYEFLQFSQAIGKSQDCSQERLKFRFFQKANPLRTANAD